jgi:hypothetical protein
MKERHEKVTQDASPAWKKKKSRNTKSMTYAFFSTWTPFPTLDSSHLNPDARGVVETRISPPVEAPFGVAHQLRPLHLGVEHNEVVGRGPSAVARLQRELLPDVVHRLLTAVKRHVDPAARGDLI